MESLSYILMTKDFLLEMLYDVYNNLKELEVLYDKRDPDEHTEVDDRIMSLELSVEQHVYSIKGIIYMLMKKVNIDEHKLHCCLEFVKNRIDYLLDADNSELLFSHNAIRCDLKILKYDIALIFNEK